MDFDFVMKSTPAFIKAARLTLEVFFMERFFRLL